MEMLKSHSYPTDLTDEKWNILKEILPQPQVLGRPPKDRRTIVNAMLYLIYSGCQWRMLPREYGPWATVYSCFRRWRLLGVWQQIHDYLVVLIRCEAGRAGTPSVGIVDSQSVKSADHPGSRGFDAGKKIKGRKRHLLVDTFGLIIAVLVTPASVQDRDGARQLLTLLQQGWTRLRTLWADGGYSGKLIEWVRLLRAHHRIRLQIIRRSDARGGFKILPKRWIVERTFAWLVKNRRLRTDYETRQINATAMIHIAMIRLMLNRLTVP